MAYLTPEARKGLRRYQYKGGDMSLIYKYLLTPMNNVLIEFIPMWMAPNLVTMTGLVVAVSSHLMLYVLAPMFDAAVPTWVYILDAFASFAYQTLDNLDGKQARRTGSSSPLGLLFDHGCDAFNSTVGALSQANTMRLGANWKVLALWQVVCTPFYLTTLEELHTGELILPIANGPTEGILLLVVTKLVTAYLGPQIWLGECPFLPGYAWNTVFTLFLWFGSYVVLAQNFLKIALHPHRKDSLATVVWQTVPYLLLQGGAMAWAYASDIEETHPRMFMWWVGLMFALMVMRVMLAHVTDQPLQPWILPFLLNLPCAALLAHQVVLGGAAAGAEVHSQTLYVLFAIAVLSFAHFVVSVVNECCSALNIRCFTITKKH